MTVELPLPTVTVMAAEPEPMTTVEDGLPPVAADGPVLPPIVDEGPGVLLPCEDAGLVGLAGAAGELLGATPPTSCPAVFPFCTRT